jgi:hypothetical protein
MTIWLMETIVTIGQPAISVKIRQLFQLDSSNGLAISANLDNGLSPWVDVVFAKQESTARM